MHLALFLQDLAVIMIVAGIVTVIFHRFKQPVVLGYIIAGLILGPHTPPFSFIHDETTVKTLAELGIIFLMFSLGLEFNIQKLFRVGAAAMLAAFAEIIVMIVVGYEIGRLFGWQTLDSIFLGAMLAISSTTIIIKALDELKMKREKFAQIIFGILIIEDILAIGILALLSSIAISGSIDVSGVFFTLAKLIAFLVVSLVIGILSVPRLLAYVAKFQSKEMLLITVLGLCFGFSLLVIRLDYSVVLGAFLMGAIMAESNEIKMIEKLVKPITDMFSAIFFVSIGLLVDPSVIVTYIIPILIISIAVILGKVLVCSASVFLAGRDGKTSLRVGMGLAQIGEFSFIIAALGMTLHVTSAFLYPIIVAVSAITTLTTPYLIKFAEPLTVYMTKKSPEGIKEIFSLYTKWLQSIQVGEERALIRAAIQKGILQVFINTMLIVAIFVAGSYLSHKMLSNDFMLLGRHWHKAFIWGAALIISLPFLIAIYRKLKALSMIAAEMTIKDDTLGGNAIVKRKIIAEIIPVTYMLGLLLMIVALSASILPPMSFLILVLVIAVLLAIILWGWFVRLHSRLQVALMKTIDKTDKPS